MKENTIYVTETESTVKAECFENGERWWKQLSKNSSKDPKMIVVNACQARLNVNKLGDRWNETNNVNYPIIYG